MPNTMQLCLGCLSIAVLSCRHLLRQLAVSRLPSGHLTLSVLLQGVLDAIVTAVPCTDNVA